MHGRIRSVDCGASPVRRDLALCAGRANRVVMTRLPPRPALNWPDPETPASLDIGDIYFSGDGLAEKRAVFLDGCGLPGAWADRPRFTIGELGFGTGLSFLAAWDLWRRHRPSPSARLDFLSFEGALLSGEDAARVHARWPELEHLSRRLVQRWPDRARGVQRIELDDGVTLTLFVDDIDAALPQAMARVDAWFLDGFSPAKNPAMWSTETLGQVGRLSAPGARAATYTVAGDVRRALEAAGFTVAKRPGVGRKRERLEADLRSDACAHSPRRTRTALVIGSGVAGAMCCRSLLRRGCEVTVVDAGDAPGAGASGNPLALVMPRLDAADGPAARALLEAYLFARRIWIDLGPDAMRLLDVAHLPRSDRERARFSRLLADPPLDETFLMALDDADQGGGLRHLGAVAIRPDVALPVLLEGAHLRFGCRVTSISETETGATASLATGETLTADLVVVCAGMGAAGIGGLELPPLEGRLGQVECAASTSQGARAVADGGYVLDAFGKLVFGATFEPAPEGPPLVSADAQITNLATLERLRPDVSNVGPLISRAAIRATTPDRLPFAGRQFASSSAHVHLIGGLGSRGFLWAPLLAELVAAETFGEPWPMEASARAILDPDRFARRALRRQS
ncbi:MAG: tRNA (5-methylaminomethyl-2-thiouridine)(34)-methyltransferase MnmD [Alphaproteobacteria bacterium]|nr:tRNA (5-methylaminomethyl-2-thiouridine)(34)-methyltransferase MnmD [Alphaproteobacteria bacterium]